MKVLITGSNGLVGSSVNRILEDSSKVTELLPTNRSNLDLFDYRAVLNFIEKNSPEIIVNCAAKVGGIYAKDYMEAVYMILQHKEPDDWVIATGETYTVREFLETSFSYFNLDWEDYVLQDSRYFRPNEVEYLHGDISKASKELKWKPKTSFNKLVEIMLEEDLKLAEKEKVLINNNMLKPTWEYPAE